MKIIINGQEKEIDTGINIQTLVKGFCPAVKNVIAEVNGEILQSQMWESKTLCEGDKIELVNFVGGG